MNLTEILTADNTFNAIIIMILIGAIAIIPILFIVAFFNISSNSTKLTKQMDFLSKQVDYLIRLEEHRQGINSNTQNISQNIQQNLPQNYNNSGFENRQ